VGGVHSHSRMIMINVSGSLTSRAHSRCRETRRSPGGTRGRNAVSAHHCCPVRTAVTPDQNLAPSAGGAHGRAGRLQPAGAGAAGAAEPEPERAHCAAACSPPRALRGQGVSGRRHAGIPTPAGAGRVGARRGRCGAWRRLPRSQARRCASARAGAKGCAQRPPRPPTAVYTYGPPAALPEHACAYCGCHSPSSVVR